MTNNPIDILIVEDNPNDVELTLHAFKSNQISNSIDVVRDGAEALDYIFCKGKYSERKFANGPRLILLDLKLPKFNGLDVLEKIRANKRTKNIPVIIFTSSDEERDIIQSYDLGANSYIRKPVAFDQFTEVVKKMGYYWFLINIIPPVQPSQD